MNLKQWSVQQGISYATARRWFASGKLPVQAHRVGGLILIGETLVPGNTGSTAVYARVSSADQKADLDGQVARVVTWCGEHHIPVDRVVTEIGSALNGRRKKFLALLADPGVTAIVVEHRDRFARFGAEYVEASLTAQGRKLIVVNPAEIDNDLVRDVTEILTSLCARLYGQRSAANRAAKALAAIESPDG